MKNPRGEFRFCSNCFMALKRIVCGNIVDWVHEKGGHKCMKQE